MHGSEIVIKFLLLNEINFMVLWATLLLLKKVSFKHMFETSDNFFNVIALSLGFE
jgi:hypothetical protein